jgi:hypothetical protein
MWVLIASKQFVWNISHSNKNWLKYDKECVLVFMSNTRYSSPIWMKFYIPWQIFETYSNMNFIRIRQVVEELFRADGRTDIDEANSRFSKFCESV